jgi:hypothetical protein
MRRGRDSSSLQIIIARSAQPGLSNAKSATGRRAPRISFHSIRATRVVKKRRAAAEPRRASTRQEKRPRQNYRFQDAARARFQFGSDNHCSQRLARVEQREIRDRPRAAPGFRFTQSGLRLSGKERAPSAVEGNLSLGALYRGVTIHRGVSRRCRRRFPSTRRRSRRSHKCEAREGHRHAVCSASGAAAASRSGKPAASGFARRPAASGLVMPTCSASNTCSASRAGPSYSYAAVSQVFQTRD